MKSINELRRHLFYWKQERKNWIKTIRTEENLPIQNMNRIDGLYWQLGIINTNIWLLKIKLEELSA